MTERHLDLLQKHRELQKAFDDTLEMNRKLGSDNWKLEKENEQLKQQIKKLECCANCANGKQGERDLQGECYYCDCDVCKCNVTGDLMPWDYKNCSNWRLAE
jgi:hypothetical protein